jgi:hypothetical protein
VCACVCGYKCVGVRTSVCERESVYVCVCVCVFPSSVCVCVRERERESARARVCVFLSHNTHHKHTHAHHTLQSLFGTKPAAGGGFAGVATVRASSIVYRALIETS